MPISRGLTQLHTAVRGFGKAHKQKGRGGLRFGGGFVNSIHIGRPITRELTTRILQYSTFH